LFGMKLVVGLGNPGHEYARTRHNAGFLVVDRLAARHAGGQAARGRFHAACVEARIAGEKCVLMKPTTYMNRSGLAVGEAVRFFKVEPRTDLVVIVDELAFPVGHIRVRSGGGDSGHNGLKDIDSALGGAEYPRVRVGIGSKPALMNQADWVLSRVTEEEWPGFEASLKDAAEAVEVILGQGVDAAMNRFNQRVPQQNAGRARTHPKEQSGAGETGGAGPGVDPGWLSGSMKSSEKKETE